MTYKFIKTQKSDNGQIFTLTINRPKKMNAVSFETLAEIEKFILEEVNPLDSQARVLILNGEGKHFTSGIDITSAA
jgi:enoyl-CoA hydratase/carnithine racemase